MTYFERHLAFVAWQSGNGALANVALGRALSDNPRYTMAQLLRQAIDSGAPPSLARIPMTPEEVAASYEGAYGADDDGAGDVNQDADGKEEDGAHDGALQDGDRSAAARVPTVTKPRESRLNDLTRRVRCRSR